MVKLMAIYNHPSDTAAFDRHFRDVHVPLIRKMPGLRRLEIARVIGAPVGEPRYHLVAEMHFDDLPALKASLKSREGVAAGDDMRNFPGPTVHMMIAEVTPG